MQHAKVFEQESLSLWLKDGIATSLPTLKEDVECDICIVGAGITGVTTAYQLNKMGLKVVLIDKAEPVHLTTGNTTAKFTFQHSLIYQDLCWHEAYSLPLLCELLFLE